MKEALRMEYRKLGRTGPDVSALGLGTEHIARERATMDAVLSAAVEAGVNYVDLVFADPAGRDASYFEAISPALRAHRDRLVLAAHWGDCVTYEVDVSQRQFEQVLGLLGNGRTEVALLTMVDDEAIWRNWALPSIERLRSYQADGRVGFIGISSHIPGVALQAVNSGLLDVLMFSANMLERGEENQALYRACAERGVALVAMKVFHGGTLLAVRGQPTGITPAQCLAYTLAQPVATTVPGPKDLAEWQAIIAGYTAGAAGLDYAPVLAGLRHYFDGQCVYCHHCEPCPQGIDIGWVIWHVDQAWTGVTPALRDGYNQFPVKASACNECGVCLSRCPYAVDIFARMRRAVELFE
jgi:uncharacterized protein